MVRNRILTEPVGYMTITIAVAMKAPTKPMPNVQTWFRVPHPSHFEG
jgi:hypothetical protein